MVFRQGRRQIGILYGLYKRSRKGDKKKFKQKLIDFGYSGDLEEAWKAYHK